MTEKRKQHRINPKIKEDVDRFWNEYKKEHNVDDSVTLVLLDTKLTIADLLNMLRS